MRVAIIVCLVALCVSMAQAAFWNIGCFKDRSAPNRRLPYKVYQGDDLTIIQCIDLCKAEDYDYAGVENGNQCFCGNQFPFAQPRDDSECDKPCTGKPGKTCGGFFRIQIYGVVVAYRGCFQDDNQNRVLPYKIFQGDNLRRIKCIRLCGNAGYKYAGVENGNQCFCGDPPAPAFPALHERECDKPCSGRAVENCGGFKTINVFNLDVN